MRFPGWIRSPWVTVAVAVLGGLSLGLGLGRLWDRPSVLAGAYALLGVILLWWAISDSRKARPDTPESEADGSHTIE
ncbi:MAG TPA: hypothetical protein VHG51_07930 [Longimicrobiaceae bacterium]|nr:hypothetical protein [Longimicrobiaceae bacterium]